MPDPVQPPFLFYPKVRSVDRTRRHLGEVPQPGPQLLIGGRATGERVADELLVG